ncbi:mitochondrial cytochrome c oxidase-like protein subunit V [Westerdykella ornata]|uniref:Cytochrome c oxidase polypeptide V n=1 Tax=Westerdykella ornata TaxID=318751 RepID=A0A6A6JUT4_WESOR|nr:mitochondrial cytochrome c oxidase-like protein subunit V [Westerdykella ornata]KAF2280342.1 mitochondrial cytochrome c oxidase-like protein subunit V [Westerdykella ornata]
MLRSSIVRASRTSASFLQANASRQAAPLACSQQTQIRQSHAISNPTLANIEKRWEDMPPQEQADLWMSLRDRMKADWKELTLQEKKAAYYIAFGPHGPRRPAPPDEGRKVFFITAGVIGASLALFAVIRMFANPARPRTMTKEWQEATEEYMKAQGTEPITFKKGMMVQSKPGPKDQFD